MPDTGKRSSPNLPFGTWVLRRREGFSPAGFGFAISGAGAIAAGSGATATGAEAVTCGSGMTAAASVTAISGSGAAITVAANAFGRDRFGFNRRGFRLVINIAGSGKTASSSAAAGSRFGLNG